MQRSSALEKGVQKFWELSKAWYGVGAIPHTYGSILSDLMPLRTQDESLPLAIQAESLANMVVHNKARRRKQKGTVTELHSHLHNKTKNIGQAIIAA